ncbi:hypothetical protein GB928_018375 [Shinella curvata]|uniref:Uncharacterized protein n=1 Tax=Shinella curvata TaxID=1817964 RepID=A0ABT8XHJ8_9HYPH|nr:hypothetical protein [Shinella curvata]MCJ8053826.1 hypothetical protein [Shinella curvata]MDO6123158.1 hypothetical protein [Shinella curvata]
MAERMTSIRLPGSKHVGLADWGRKSREEMIKMIRDHAADQRSMADAILAASDDDFLVETYTGVHVHRNREVIHPASALEAAE